MVHTEGLRCHQLRQPLAEVSGQPLREDSNNQTGTGRYIRLCLTTRGVVEGMEGLRDCSVDGFRSHLGHTTGKLSVSQYMSEHFLCVQLQFLIRTLQRIMT